MMMWMGFVFLLVMEEAKSIREKEQRIEDKRREVVEPNGSG